MADVTKDLVVRLAFEHGDTKSQISAIKNELKLMDSAFDVAANSAGGFATAADRTAAKAETLKGKLSAQQLIVQKYGEALNQARDKLSRFADNHDKYGQKLETAKKKNSELKDKMKELADELEACAKSSGENSEEYAKLSEELEKMKISVAESDDEVKKLTQSFASSDKSMQSAANSVMKAETAYNSAVAAQGAMETELEELNTRLKNHSDQLEATSEKLGKLSDSTKKVSEVTGKIGSTMTKASATIVAAGVAAAGTAISWEDSFASVRKTVDGTDEELAQIEQRLLEMGTEIPVALSDLADIAANAGQLGIATDYVVSFTETMAMLAETTDMTADSASTSFAQYANITGMSQTQFENLGSAVVELGNNTATTESSIMNMATRIAAAGTQAGMTDAQILGISAALSSMGIASEAGGSAFSKIMAQIQTDVETGSEKLEQWAEVSGMTADQFAAAWKEDASEAFISFVKGLGTNTKSATVLLDELGLTELRLSDTLKRSSGNWELLEDCITMADSAFEENIALQNEADVRNATTASQLQLLKTELQEMAITFGQELLPYVKQGVEFLSNLINKFSELSTEQKDSIIKWGAIVAAVGPALKAFSGITSGVSQVTGALSKITKAAASGSTSMAGVTAALKTLGTAGLWSGVVAGASYLTLEFLRSVTGAKALKESLEELEATAQEWAGTNITTRYEGAEGMSAFGLTADDFKPEQVSQEFGSETTTWVDDTIKTWTDGALETDEILSEAIKGFTDESDKVRDNLMALNEGGDLPTIEEDIELLNEMDDRVQELLTKRQNGFLSDEEKQELSDLYAEREAITVKYRLVEETGNGFEAIRSGVEAAMSRGADSEETFTNAFAASTEGYGAFMDELNSKYDEEYAKTLLIENENERLIAQQQLLADYEDQKQVAAQEYSDTVIAAAEATGAFGEGGSYTDTIEAMNAVKEAMASGDAVELNNAMSQLDETQIVEAATAFGNLQAMAEESGVAIPEDLQLMMDAFNTTFGDIQTMIGNNTGLYDQLFTPETMAAINQMFGENVSAEVHEVNVALGADSLNDSWDAWAAGEHSAVNAQAEVDEIDGTALVVNGAVLVPANLSTVTATSGTAYDVVKVDGQLYTVDTTTGIVSGTVTVDGNVGTIYDREGNAVDTITLDGEIDAVDLPAEVIEAIPAVELHGIVNGEIDVSGIEPPEIPVNLVPAVVKSTGDQMEHTGFEDLLTLIGDYENIVSHYAELGEDMEEVGEGMASAELEGIKSLFLSFGDIDTDSIANHIAALWAALSNPDGMSAEDLAETEEEFKAYAQIMEYADKTLGEGNYVTGGVSSGLAEFGTEVTPETLVSAMKGVIGEAVPEVEEAAGALGTAAQDGVKKTLAEGEPIDIWGDYSEYDLSDSQIAEMKAQLDELGAEDYSEIADGLKMVMDIINNPMSDMSDADKTAMLQEYLNIIGNADQYLGTGNNVTAGIAEGMESYDFSASAGTVEGNLESQLKSALGIASPATTMVPLGGYVSAGIAEGIEGYDFSASVGTVKSAISTAFGDMSTSGKQIGQRFGQGVKSGLESSLQSALITARSYANKITATMQTAWDIHSPSRKAEWLAEMFGKGIQQGINTWPSVPDALLEAGTMGTTQAMQQVSHVMDKRDYSATSQVTISNLNVRSDSDIEDIARQLAGYTERLQRRLV